ncbi:MAG: NAD-dependent epimerase/dehydratase family protein, partial [Haloechinothrix sp.]
MLVTGAAGFVGSHLCEALLADGHEVVGVDGFVESYPRLVKLQNLSGLLSLPRFTFLECDLRTAPLQDRLAGIDVVVNEAAMPG